MSGPYVIEYYDRRENRKKPDRVAAARFIRWAYNTRSGRFAESLIFGTKAFSRVYGRIHKSRWSRRKIGPFIKKLGVDMGDVTEPLGNFSNFYDFFIRDIDLSRRPVVSDPAVCVAPVDGRILAYRDVAPDRSFQIKRAVFNLRAFLKDDGLAGFFEGGTLVISRLGLADYHYVHFPFSGIPHPPVSIPGKYYASGPYSLGRLIPFYASNFRMVTLVDSDHFGRAAIVEIGALSVGSIRQLFSPDSPVVKGARKARFELGGSTVALLFEKGKIEIDPDLLAHTEEGLETYVRLGDSIGRGEGAA
jgi:phosphatidylserine decarboxylase